MSISTQIARIVSAVSDIKAAITGKGVAVSDSATIDDLAALIESIETGGSSSVITARGTFEAGSSGATYVDVTFEQELDSTPTLIFFWEATTSYASTARTKGGFGMTERIAHYGTSGATTYYQRRWYGSTSNSMSSGSSSYSITASNGQCIRNATKTGFRAYYYSSSYKLYGTFNYIAVIV